MARNKKVQASVSESVYEDVRRLAEQNGLSVSAYVGMLLTRHVGEASKLDDVEVMRGETPK